MNVRTPVDESWHELWATVLPKEARKLYDQGVPLSYVRELYPLRLHGKAPDDILLQGRLIEVVREALIAGGSMYRFGAMIQRIFDWEVNHNELLERVHTSPLAVPSAARLLAKQQIELLDGMRVEVRTLRTVCFLLSCWLLPDQSGLPPHSADVTFVKLAAGYHELLATAGVPVPRTIAAW